MLSADTHLDTHDCVALTPNGEMYCISIIFLLIYCIEAVMYSKVLENSFIRTCNYFVVF